MVVIGILTYVTFKNKSTESSFIKDIGERLCGHLLEFKEQYASQSKHVYSVLEKIPQLLETITKGQEEMVGMISSLDKQFGICNDAILQGSQTIKNELISTRDSLHSSLSAMDGHLNEGVAGLSIAVEKAYKAHITKLENHFSELGTSVDKSTEAIGSAVNGLLNELTTQLTAITAEVTASSTAISEAVSSGFNEEIEWQKSAMTERSGVVTSQIEDVRKEISESVVEISKELTSLGLSVGKNIEGIRQSIDIGMIAHSDRLKTMAKDITSSLNTDLSKLNEVAREQNETISNVAATISDDIAKGLTLCRGIQEEVKQNIEKTLEQNSRNQIQCLELITALQNVQSQFGKDITNQKSVVEETVTKVNVQIQDSFLGFTRSLNKSNESLKEVLARQFVEMKETIEDLPDSLEDAFKSAVGESINDMGMSISNLQQMVEELDKFGEYLIRYEEQLNGLSKSETSIMNQFENIIRGKR